MLLQLNPVELEAVSSYWYLKFADYWGGPFSYIEILQMLKARRINRTMKIRAGRLANENSGQWHFISDLDEFSVDFISEFSKYYVPKDRSFDKIRKFVRVKYSFEVLIISESGKIHTCLCKELSAGGAKIQVPAGFVEQGEGVTIQFFYNPNIKLKSFKAKAKVLRLSEINFGDETGRDEVHETYALEFKDLKAKYKRMIFHATQIKINKLAGYIRDKQKDVVDVLDLNEFAKNHPYLMINP